MVVDSTYYDVLELATDAGELEIRKNYRSMALKWHPDKNNHSLEATTRFQQITKAYQVLVDPVQRDIYDKYGEGGINGEVPIEATDGSFFYFNQANNGDEANPEQRPKFHNPKYNSYYDNSPTVNANTTSFNTTTNINNTTNYNTSFDQHTNNFNSVNSPFIQQNGQANNLFSQFFGDYQKPAKVIPKSPTIKHKLSCSLSELYHGRRTKLGLSRRILCPHCKGKGGTFLTCKQCVNGKLTLDNGQYHHQNIEILCQNCKGTTEIMTEICGHCKGLKFIKEKKILNLFIKPGSMDHDEIVFHEQGDQGHNVLPGDVVVCIDELRHEFFTRMGDDLFCKVKIPLIDSLTGGVIYINHLDKTKLKIQLHGVVKPNSEKFLRNYGMPKKSSTHHHNVDEDINGKSEFGNLVIKFEIEFPTEVNIEHHEGLRKILMSPNEEEDSVDSEQKVVVIDELLDYNELLTQPTNEQHTQQEQNCKKRKNEV